MIFIYIIKHISHDIVTATSKYIQSTTRLTLSPIYIKIYISKWIFETKDISVCMKYFDIGGITISIVNPDCQNSCEP